MAVRRREPEAEREQPRVLGGVAFGGCFSQPFVVVVVVVVVVVIAVFVLRLRRRRRVAGPECASVDCGPPTV